MLVSWERWEPWTPPPLAPPPRVVSPLCYGSWTPHLAAPPRCLVAAVTAARKHIPGPPRGPPDPARSRSSQGHGQAGGPSRSGGGGWFPQPIGQRGGGGGLKAPCVHRSSRRGRCGSSAGPLNSAPGPSWSCPTLVQVLAPFLSWVHLSLAWCCPVSSPLLPRPGGTCGGAAP